MRLDILVPVRGLPVHVHADALPIGETTRRLRNPWINADNSRQWLPSSPVIGPGKSKNALAASYGVITAAPRQLAFSQLSGVRCTTSGRPKM